MVGRFSPLGAAIRPPRGPTADGLPERSRAALAGRTCACYRGNEHDDAKPEPKHTVALGGSLMSEPVLLVDKSEGVATLTLNRPQALNALSRSLRGAIVEAFAALGDDRDVGVVILTGAGRAFCAGLDLKELGGEGETREGARSAVTGLDVVGALTSFDRPVIGAVNGFAITGGFELALACDVLIASTEARFADTHARVGIMPGWGLSQKLSRAVGIYRAKELSLTGNFLSAERAEAWGLVNRVVPPEELLPTSRALAADMMSCVPEVMRHYRQVIDQGFAATFGEGLEIEARAAREHARRFTPEMLAARRAQIQDRGRRQAKS
jgi:enoyl-CoA hydratase